MALALRLESNPLTVFLDELVNRGFPSHFIPLITAIEPSKEKPMSIKVWVDTGIGTNIYDIDF